MPTSEQVKAYAKECGADLVGIGSMDRFEGAPKQMDPRYIFPEAKAAVVLGFPIPRGCIRECMIHLEETGRIENVFKHPFRKRKAWRL